jgi:hypothetical protein
MPISPTAIHRAFNRTSHQVSCDDPWEEDYMVYYLCEEALPWWAHELLFFRSKHTSWCGAYSADDDVYFGSSYLWWKLIPSMYILQGGMH